MHVRVPVLCISVAAAGMLCFSGAANSPRLVWNATASAPTGLYAVEQGAWRVGDRVAVRPSPSLAEDLDRRGILSVGKLLIKRVVAGQGDRVCRDADRVTLNGSLVAEARWMSLTGELLPAWAGCRKLGVSEIFLLGDTANSYDGRYFGVTSAQDVIGRVTMVLAL